MKDKNLYFVGGIVRDEILGAASFDTDYCYEGDAISFARSKGFNILRENPAFGTVRIEKDGKEIDIASTRVETYPKKGHLPKVEKIGCSLKEDVLRRDFTINSLYKRTTDGEVIDFTGKGLNDIKEGRITVLHDESFVDDPTRIIRALKFSVRFGFELDERTRQLQTEYLDNINYDMSYHRVKKELVETFNLNKYKAYERFISENIYKLLGENQESCILSDKVEQFDVIYPWLKYMAFFNLEKFELTRVEKRILEWAERLKTEAPNNNTPEESIIIDKIRRECRC